MVTSGSGCAYSLNKNHKEPFQRVQNGVKVVLIEMLLQLWQELREDFVMMAEEAHELGKADDVKSVHGELLVDHQRVQRPEGFFLVQVEKQNADHRRHSLAVADFHVVHRVG